MCGLGGEGAFLARMLRVELPSMIVARFPLPPPGRSGDSSLSDCSAQTLAIVPVACSSSIISSIRVKSSRPPPLDRFAQYPETGVGDVQPPVPAEIVRYLSRLESSLPADRVHSRRGAVDPHLQRGERIQRG